MTRSDSLAECQARIRELEAELDDMTESLAQAWDQLVPFLQETPQQAESTQDIIPVLESIMTAVDAEIGAVYLYPHNARPAEWYTIPSMAVNLGVMQPHLDELAHESRLHRGHHIPSWNGTPTHWLLTSIVAGDQIAGAIGVGLTEGRREFNAYDVRTLMRMTERAASQIVVTSLAESRAREAQLAHEMQIAGLIQRSIQPAVGPSIAGLDVAADWQPAATVGGDAWGWVMQPSGRMACFVLDVAGKGLPAALAAVSLHTAIMMTLRLDRTPAETLGLVNDMFYDAYTEAGILATATLIAIDPMTGEIEQANSGHTPTLFCRSGVWHQWTATAPPIGVLLETVPEPQYSVFHPDDLIVCYSDGLSEIETASGLWNTQGILQAIPQGISNARQLVNTILSAAEELRDGAPIHDDQTMLTVRFTDKPGGSDA
ncbi:MAG: SpoIIE family protein phosphatase [Anaerolineae bacterium]|nr:SpoIIE family protein phosphatase [Anaerolineae bacterium]